MNDGAGASNNFGYSTQRDATDANTPLNVAGFVFEMLMGRIATAQVVTVLNVHIPADTLSSEGTVDVQIMVNQIDGLGNVQEHETIYGMPYFRYRGGANTVIIDPEVNDNGVALFMMRDISAVVSTKKVSNPGSQSRFSYSDGLYMGGWLNGPTTQYLRLRAAGGGIDIISPLKITLTAPTVEINASSAVNITTPTATIDGEEKVTGEITAMSSGPGVTVSQHKHTQGNDSHGDAEVPVNAPTPGT